MSPADERALLHQGIAAARAGDKTSARTRFRELTARNFDNELAWLWLASVADTPAHAVACLRRVLQINPSHGKARAALFRVLMEGGIQTARAGDKASAYASFSDSAALEPESELVWTWMASTAPSPGKALDALRRVLEINPSHEQAGRAYRKLVVQRGIDLAQAGDPGARALLTEASGVDPMNETIWLWLARAVSPEESIEYYERILDINPHHEAARAALQQLRPPPAPMIAAGPAPAELDPSEDDGRPVLRGVGTISLDASDIPEIMLVDEAADAVDVQTHDSAVNGSEEWRAAVRSASPNGSQNSRQSGSHNGSQNGSHRHGQSDGGSNNGADGLIVEQFSQVGEAEAQSSQTQAATREEFVIYHGADISAVWGQDAAAKSASAAADRAALVDTMRPTSDAVAAFESVQDGASAVAVSGVSASDVSASDVAASDVTASDLTTSDHIASDHMASDVTASDVTASDIAESDVDSYLAASASTYASSELVVAATHVRVETDSDTRSATDNLIGAGTPTADPAIAVPDPGADLAADAPAAASGANTGAWAGAPSSAQANAPIAWNCPICLSGAPQNAVRCPICGSVVTLVDPDLLLDTDAVDRRHVLQVVARLKNRKVAGGKGRQQFDHYFTLGLAYINAGRVTEGIGHLRMAHDAQKADPELKAQIDSLERRATQRAKSAASGPPKAPGAATSHGMNGTATKTPGPPAQGTPADLPIAPPPVEAPAEAHDTKTPHGTNGNGSRRIILIVDDSPTIQKVVSVTLEAHGHEVVTASDGMEALSKLRTLKPDLVLLDITMPHMDGYQLCRILRSNDLTRQVPIVMLSGKDGLFDKMRGRMAGAASYITKPFAPSALPPLVEKYCKRVC